MPTIKEFIENFGLWEFVLSIATVIAIVLAREEKKIFRRKKDV